MEVAFCLLLKPICEVSTHLKPKFPWPQIDAWSLVKSIHQQLYWVWGWVVWEIWILP